MTDIIPSVSLDRLFAQREAARKALEKIAEGVAEYQSIGSAILTGHEVSGYRFNDPIALRGSDYRHELTSPKWLDESMKSLDTALWGFLFDQSGLRTFLDAEGRTKWQEQLNKHDVPPLTPENIRATFRALHDSRGEMFGQAVCSVFRGLSWDYKTNKPQMFGKRLILTCVIDRFGHAASHTCDRFDDLIRALHVLDNKPEPDHRQGSRFMLSRGGFGAPPPTWESDYFNLRTYKNGNGHLTFKRPDLVDELNRILQKYNSDALPATDAPPPKPGSIQRTQ